MKQNLLRAAPFLAVAVFALKANKAGLSPLKVMAGTALIGGVIGLIEFGVANRSAA